MQKHTDPVRQAIRNQYLARETDALSSLIEQSDISVAERTDMSGFAAKLVETVRAESRPSMMESFLAEYGLTTKEGVALMCLAEALLRVPDSDTIDALIEDKVAFGQWRDHLGRSASGLVNTSTWSLMLTGKLIAPSDDGGIAASLRSMLKRLGEPVVRVAVTQAMKELGRQFVLGTTIEDATRRAAKQEAKGYTYSYDMLGEAARTEHDALAYLASYRSAIESLRPLCQHAKIADNPGISVKLSALHPRYEFAKRERVMAELVERTLTLARAAQSANMGFNIDAEEADRLDLSLDIIEAVLSNPDLAGWDGFGVVVQAFGPRAPHVIDWLHALATRLDRRIMVRLVKGAYWDAEIKRAQTLGLEGFPVYTRKLHSDVSYICCAKKLLGMIDRIYPQFATHNAHSVSAVLRLAGGLQTNAFEFQRLHGMGEALHDAVLTSHHTRCRIYAPVGKHRDLLAYLVRRLLENGANSSFVNQIVDTRIPPETIARDPFTVLEEQGQIMASKLINPASQLFQGQRRNSKGYDITHPDTFAALATQRERFRSHRWQAKPLIAGDDHGGEVTPVFNPANPYEVVGEVTSASPNDIETAITAARNGFASWSAKPAAERADVLERVAEQFEAHSAELFALTQREAGKTLPDAIGEVREAVDFAYYYAAEARKLSDEDEARGVITCISPWNFPLAIFTGQILAAVGAGNAVLAKPADQTPLIAARAVQLMYSAGIPTDVVQLLPGRGAEVGAALTGNEGIDGVCFTGSTLTARKINLNMANKLSPSAPLIAETGGLNAMIVDSTALPEQVVRDVLASAFQSAGQRCSALRILYLQEEIAASLLEMLFGAMDELQLGNPWALTTDIGPVIDRTAKDKINLYCESFRSEGRLLKQLAVPASGLFVAPTVLKVSGISDMPEEIFGPVLHVATYPASALDQVIQDINASGYGLTFGLHTRMDTRIEKISKDIQSGNIYVNRNQIGAVVGSQPFGGERLSGTGPKAGGPAYLPRFTHRPQPVAMPSGHGDRLESDQIQQAVDKLRKLASDTPKPSRDLMTQVREAFSAIAALLPDAPFEVKLMPGPTGELNRLSHVSRGVVLCLGADTASGAAQTAIALSTGNRVISVFADAESALQDAVDSGLPVIALNGAIDALTLSSLEGISAVAGDADAQTLRSYREALAARGGELIPLITDYLDPFRYLLERHLCIDTTAAGGNASLIASSE